MRDKPRAVADSAGYPVPVLPDGLTEDQQDAIIGDMEERLVHGLSEPEQPDQGTDGVFDDVIEF